jgi:hypothetical protein
MTDRTLSPNTQAIYDAFNRIGLYNEPSFETDRKALAAALRALVGANAYEVEGEGWYSLVIDVDDIYAIAAELEAQ